MNNDDILISVLNCLISLCKVTPQLGDFEKQQQYIVERDKIILRKNRKEKLMKINGNY